MKVNHTVPNTDELLSASEIVPLSLETASPVSESVIEMASVTTNEVTDQMPAWKRALIRARQQRQIEQVSMRACVCVCVCVWMFGTVDTLFALFPSFLSDRMS
jgi:hypothetical protein